MLPDAEPTPDGPADATDVAATDVQVDDAVTDDGGSKAFWQGLLLASVVLTVVAIGLIVFAVVRGEDEQAQAPAGPGRTYTYVVPAGSGARVDRGEVLWDVFPHEATVRVGDTYVIINEDDRVHYLGPFTVRAGETLTYTFPQAGVYKGACTVHGPDYESVITVV